MSVHEDEDGIDGPFDRAMDAAMKDDAKRAAKRAPTNADCGTCSQPITGAGYDPGHSYGCGYISRACDPRGCHERSCSEACYLNAAERQDQARRQGAV